MPPIRSNSKDMRKKSQIISFSKLYGHVENLLFNPSKSSLIMLFLLPVELILNLAIVFNVKCNFLNCLHSYHRDNCCLFYFKILKLTGLLICKSAKDSLMAR